jgi:hypothetical protein
MENMTVKTFALLEFMKNEGFHQIPFENCKIPENQNYVEKLNFGLNIDFTPINTRLNLLISESNDSVTTESGTATNNPSTTPDSNTSSPTTDTTTTDDTTATNTDNSTTDPPSARILSKKSGDLVFI